MTENVLSGTNLNEEANILRVVLLVEEQSSPRDETNERAEVKNEDEGYDDERHDEAEPVADPPTAALGAVFPQERRRIEEELALRWGQL